MADRIDNVLSFNTAALKLRGERQGLLAANLANADTPHYKAVDIKFADALRSATSGKGGPLEATQPRHLQPGNAGPGGAAVLYRTPSQPSVDGNTVDADAERARFADNTVRYEAALRFLNQQIKTLLAAVQGQ